MQKHSERGALYIQGIDGLRAIAVLSVILYHFKNAALPGGFTGVDIFFVISGFVISRSLAISREAGPFSYLLAFYKRRVLRILPALLVLLISTSVVSSLFVPDGWLSSSNRETALWATFGGSNFFLVNGVDGYFSQRIAFNPFAHTWSLAVEEQFYLFFPMILYLSLDASGASPSRRQWRFFLLPTLAVASLGYASLETPVEHDRAFYLLPSRFWELAAGALLFQAQDIPAFARWMRAHYVAVLFAGSALIITGFAFASDLHFPFPWALLPVVGGFLMIAGTVSAEEKRSIIQDLLRSQVMTYIGRISYSLYLWHWPVFTLFRWTVGMDSWTLSLMALALTLLLSATSYHIVEKTFRAKGFANRQANWKVAAAGLASVAISYVAISVLYKLPGGAGLNLSVTSNLSDWSAYYIWQPYLPSSNTGDLVGKGKKLIVIGDSHAGAYDAMLKLSAARLGAELKLFSLAGCPIAKLNDVSSDAPYCRAFEASALGWIDKNARPGDVVFLASFRLYRFGDQWATYDISEVLHRSARPAEVERRRLALMQAGQLIDWLDSRRLHVLLDAPKPLFRAPPFRCSDWFNRSNPICAPGFEIPRDLLLNFRAPIVESINELSKKHGAYTWDPFPILCPGPVCSAFAGDKPIFTDGDHLSGYGNRMLVSSFCNRLEEIWKRDH